MVLLSWYEIIPYNFLSLSQFFKNGINDNIEKLINFQRSYGENVIFTFNFSENDQKTFDIFCSQLIF